MIRYATFALALAALAPSASSRPSPQSTTPCTYEVRDLGSLPGGTETRGIDLNSLGQVVGCADRANGETVPFLWLPSSAYGLAAGMNDLGHLPGMTWSQPKNINSSGQVSGFSLPSDGVGPGRGFVWLPAPALSFSSAGIHDLGTLGGQGTYRCALNDAGRIVGGSETLSTYSPFRWDSGIMTNLGHLGSGTCGAGDGLNELGEIVGRSRLAGCGASTAAHAWLWLPAPKYGMSAGLNDLGTLGGLISHAADLNDLGQIVGYSDTSIGGQHPYVWLPSPAYGLAAGMNDLGTLGGPTAKAHSIENSGVVLGTSDTASGARHGFLWKDGAMFDCNDLVLTPGWAIEEAHALNAAGQIVATAISPNGETRAVLLEPAGPSVVSSESSRFGTPPNPDAFHPGVTTGPIIGQTWDPVIDHNTFAPSAFLDFVGISIKGPANQSTALGTLLILPPFENPIIFNASPGTPFAIPIPNDCSFVGVNVWTQGGSVSPGPVIELANALDLVLGNV